MIRTINDLANSNAVTNLPLAPHLQVGVRQKWRLLIVSQLHAMLEVPPSPYTSRGQ